MWPISASKNPWELFVSSKLRPTKKGTKSESNGAANGGSGGPGSHRNEVKI